MSNRKGKRRVKVIEASGTHYEIGFQYGTACPEISKMLDITCQIFGGRKETIALAEKYMPMYLPPADEYAGIQHDPIKGDPWMSNGWDSFKQLIVDKAEFFSDLWPWQRS